MDSDKALSSCGSGERLRRDILALESSGLRVEGSSGLGKTTLLFETYELLKAGPEALAGAVRFTSGAEPPVLPILAGLGELLGVGLQRAQLTIEQLVERLPAELARLARSLGKVMLALGAEQGAGEPGSRWRMRETEEPFELVVRTWKDEPTLCEQVLCRLLVMAHREFIQRLGRVSMVLVLDQLERAGRQSRRLVETLLHLPPGVLKVLASWDEAEDGCPEFATPSPALFVRLRISPWSGETLLEQYKALGGRKPLTTSQLVEVTGGKPLALRVLLWSERQRGLERPQISASSALQSLLDGLHAPGRELLFLLAVLPAPLQLSRAALGTLLNLEPHHIDPVIDELKTLGVVRHYSRQLLLTHGLVREAVLEGLSPEQSRVLGQRLVRLLETQHSRDMVWGCLSPFSTAFHQGLELMEDPRAARACLELCDGWMSFGEWNVASVYAERLGEFSSGLTDLDRARWMSLRGRIAYERRAFTQSALLFQQAGEAFTAARDQVGNAQARLSRAASLQASGDLASAKAILKGLTDSTPRERLSVAWEAWQRLAQLCTLEGDSAGATEAMGLAVEAAHGHISVKALSRLLRELAELHLATANLQEGISYLEQALEYAQQAKDRAHVSELMMRLATALELESRPEAAEDYWRHALEGVMEDSPHESLWCTLSAGYGAFLQRQGRLEESMEVLLQALDLAREAGLVKFEAMLLGEAALAYDAAGNVRTALDYASRSLNLRRREGDVRAIAVGCNTLGTLHFEAGHLDQAKSLLEESARLWSKLDETSSLALAHNNLAMVLEARGDVSGAQSHFEQALALRERLDDPHALRYTLTNLVVFQESMRYLAGAEMWLRQLIAIDRQLYHEELGLEEQYLTHLTRRLPLSAAMAPR